MNVPLLLRLIEAGDAFVAPAELGGEAGAILDDLDELEAFGYAFERHPYRGIAYRGPARRLCPDLIEWELGTRRIGRRVAVWSRVSSTNDLAARAAASSANDGLVLMAEEQTAGRGRRGRRWSAPPSTCILMSALVFPPAPLDDPGWLTALGAVATVEAVERWADRPASIKWPNDVLVGGRKIAGILVERGSGAVIGVGLNVNALPEDYPEEIRPSLTSIRSLRGGEEVDRSLIARDLIRALDSHYADGLDRGAAPLAGAWRDRLEGLGQSVVVATTTGPLAGRLIDADPRLGLTLRLDDGSTRHVPGVDVVGLTPPRATSPAI